MKFDIEKLKMLDEYNVMYALGNFLYSTDFFNELADFTKMSRGYLQMFNPTLVVYSSDIKADFLKELERVRQIFRRLGIRLNGSELENLEEAALNGNEKALSDGLVKLSAKMDIMTQRILSAQLNNDAEIMPVVIPTGKPLILAVDDSHEVLSTINGILDDKYRVITVTSGATTLKAIETLTPALFIMDTDMPGMSGYELVSELRKMKRFAHTPIIFLTVGASRDHVLTAMALGVREYVLKPVEKHLLLEKVKRCLR